MRKILTLLCAILFNSIVGGIFAVMFSFAPIVGVLLWNVGSLLLSLLAPQLGVVRAGLYAELWTGETIKAFRDSLASIGWLNKIRSYDAQVAKNNTIHFVDLGGDPTVLVNNTTYPLAIESIADADKAISLDKYQTKPTRVSDDEARGLSYDKKSSVIERHIESVNARKIAQALHALAPQAASATTPLIVTTGESDGTHKRVTVQDIINLKKAFDAQKVPMQGRVLVLCPEHVSDLLIQDTTFAQRYNNTTTGAIANLYGFEVYEYADTPIYNAAQAKKKDFGAAASNTDTSASIAFYAPRMMKATGETKAYLDEPDTQNQEWRYNLRHYFVCLPLKNEAIGAILSAKA